MASDDAEISRVETPEMPAVPTRKPWTKWSPALADRAIGMLTDIGPHHGFIAQGIGVTRETLRQYLKNDAEFRERWDAAVEARNVELEREARRRAVEGVTRRKYDKDGNLIEEEQVYSDRLMEKLLEADMPERFRDRGPFVKDGVPGGVLLIPVVPISQGSSVEDLQGRLEKLSASQRILEEEGLETPR